MTIKDKIFEILKNDIHYVSQTQTWLSHGAIENIEKLILEEAEQAWDAATKYLFDKMCSTTDEGDFTTTDNKETYLLKYK